MVLGTASDAAAPANRRSCSTGAISYDAVPLSAKDQAVPSCASGRAPARSRPASGAISRSRAPKGYADKVQTQFLPQPKIMAPVQAGQTLGTLKVTIEGKLYGEYPVTPSKCRRRRYLRPSHTDSVKPGSTEHHDPRRRPCLSEWPFLPWRGGRRRRSIVATCSATAFTRSSRSIRASPSASTSTCAACRRRWTASPRQPLMSPAGKPSSSRRIAAAPGRTSRSPAGHARRRRTSATTPFPAAVPPGLRLRLAAGHANRRGAAGVAWRSPCPTRWALRPQGRFAARQRPRPPAGGRRRLRRGDHARDGYLNRGPRRTSSSSATASCWPAQDAT